MKKFLVFLLLAIPAFAAPWEIDADHSTVGFSVKHLMVTNVAGQFSKFDGRVELEGKKAIQVSIDANSINTNNKKRDDHLRNPDFFDTKKYPKITFKGVVFDGSESKFKVTGDLTLHGVTKPVTFDVDAPETVTKDPWGNMRRGLSATTEINRQDFGIKWSKTMDGGGAMLSDTVKVQVDLSLKQPAPKKS